MSGLARLMQPFSKIQDDIKTSLIEKYKNIHLVPKFLKVVVSMCVKEATSDNKLVPRLKKYFASITGQEPVYVYAKTSVANFHLREGMLIGLKTTLRGHKMLYFLEKLIYHTITKINNFKGLTEKNLDGKGNLNIGITDIRTFLELKHDAFDTDFGFKSKFGLNISIETSTNKNEEALELFDKFNFPFIKKARGAK